MTAISVHPVETDLYAVRRRAGWPWLTTAMIFIAFLLATHDPLASRQWQQMAKVDLTTLGTEEANGRVVRQMGFLLLGVVGLALVARRSNRPIRPNMAILFPLGMLAFWAVMSIAWAADPPIAFKRQIVLVCMLLAVFGVVRQFDIKTIAEMAFAITVGVVVIGVIAEVVYAPRSDPGEEYRFAGTLHPNHTGLSAAFLLMCSLYLARRRGDRRFLLFVPVALAVIILSKSRTALAGAIVGSAAFMLAVRPLRQKFTLVIAVALVLGVAAVLVSTDAMPHLSEIILLNRKNSDPTTLTGRTTIWHYVWGYLSTDWGTLLAGFGYGGFWDKVTAQIVSQRANFKLGEAHDDYLELMTQLGLVGLFLYLWGLLAMLLRSISQVRRFRSVDAGFAIGLIAFTLVHSIAESAMTLPVFTTLVFWSVLGSAALTGGNERETGELG